MLSLKSIEIVGFKSFAKKAQLEFKTPITAIVGPNGSGKSNVAEAFRFVLGEQSIKSMRGKRTEDLIWNGSNMAPRANRASVKLVFDNRQQEGQKRLFDLPYDEVTLERTIHRDAMSEYSLNGSSVRLRDIIELLAGAHIGASGHHIISQGEADRILSVNPKERKSMLEEALGLKIYHYKKEESVRKLEKTEENLEKAEALRQEIKPHLAFLKKQVAKLEKARELSQELTVSYKEYFAREHIYITTTKSRLERERTPLEIAIVDIEEKLSQARSVLSELEHADSKTTETVRFEESLAAVRKEKDTIARELGRIEGEISAIKRQHEREEQRISQQHVENVPFPLISEFIEGIEKELVAPNADISVLQRSITAVKGLISAFKARLHESNAVDTSLLEELAGSLITLQNQKSELEARIQTASEKEQETIKAYHTLQSDIEKDRTSSREAERTVFALSNQLSELRMKLQQISSKEETIRLEDEEFKRELGEAGTLVSVEATRYQEKEEELLKTDLIAGGELRHVQEERKRTIERMKIRLEDAGAANSEEIMKEHTEVEARDQFLEREIEDLRQTAGTLKGLIADLEETLSNEFTVGLKKINIQFTEFFGIMFGGGNATLDLVRQEKRKKKDTDIYDVENMEELSESNEKGEEGIEIGVSLPRKKIHGLEMLSGGERALTSIALIFAMSQVNPPPFIILDETDAALDEANSRRYGDMIENLARQTQLILITHNRETMSRAGVLYGVTMGSDAVSQLLSVSLEEAVAVAK